MTKADLGELLERVEGAGGPDRELDLAIGLALGVWSMVPSGWEDHGEWLSADGDFYASTGPGSGYPSPTESLDYALGLVEKVLPGWWWLVRDHDDLKHKGFANIGSDRAYGTPAFPTYAATPALAILAALLKALIAQDTSHG